MVLAVGGYTIVFDPRVVDGHIASFESTELDDHLVDGWVSPVDYTIAPWVKALVVWGSDGTFLSLFSAFFSSVFMMRHV